MILEKYQITSDQQNYGLFLVKDTGGKVTETQSCIFADGLNGRFHEFQFYVKVISRKTKIHEIEKNIYISERRILQQHEFPLLLRVNVGPHEDVTKFQVMELRYTTEIP